MTELEKKAEEYLKELGKKKIPFSITNAHNCIKQAYKDGYESCQKDLLNWTDREQLVKENVELKTKLEYVLNCNEELTCKLETIQNYILNFNFERDIQIVKGIEKVIEK